MDKENKTSSNDANDYTEDDQDVFEDALEESIDDEINENVDLSTNNNSTIKSTSISMSNSTNKTINNDAKEVLIEKQDNKTNISNGCINISNNKLPNTSLNENDLKQKQESDNQLRIKDKISKFKVYTIEDGVDKCIQSAFQLNKEFFEDEFEFVIEFCSQNYEKNIFYSLIYAGLYFVKTWMGFASDEIQKCALILNQCAEYVNSRRKAYGWSDLVKKVNYNEGFTDEEVHAEITYGELQILIGAITFIKDQNFTSLFKGALKFKQGYQSFKFCSDIYLNRTKWSSDIAREEFKSNLSAARGVFLLSIALAPPKVAQLLEFVGFTCDENYALETLKKSVHLENTIKSNYALIMMLVYYCYTRVTVGYGNYQLDEYEELLEIFKKRNPNSMFTKYFMAKELQLSGELDKSITKFNQIVEIPKGYFNQINNACYWELLSLHAAKGEYNECAKVADTLRTTSLWSPCVFNFIYGISLYMIKEQTGNSKLQDEIDECLREVPSLRRRLAGKSTPIEKLAMSKCNYYFSHDRKLALPLLELMYYYNLTCTFMRNKDAINDNLKLIEDKLKEYDESQLSKTGQTNDYCLLLTLKASYLRHMGYPSLAIETLEKMFGFSKEIDENHLIPFATQELGFCYLQLEEYDLAKRLFKSCINHSKYTAELILHFRAYNALRLIKRITKKSTNVQKEKQVQNSSSNDKIEVSA